MQVNLCFGAVSALAVSVKSVTGRMAVPMMPELHNRNLIWKQSSEY
jgi:hypothetical protein